MRLLTPIYLLLLILGAASAQYGRMWFNALDLQYYYDFEFGHGSNNEAIKQIDGCETATTGCVANGTAPFSGIGLPFSNCYTDLVTFKFANDSNGFNAASDLWIFLSWPDDGVYEYVQFRKTGGNGFDGVVAQILLIQYEASGDCNSVAEIADLEFYSVTDAPTLSPTDAPTFSPTDAPSDAPTKSPTDAPTTTPTDAPTDAPTLPPWKQTMSTTDGPDTISTPAVQTNTEGGFTGTTASPNLPTVSASEAPTVQPSMVTSTWPSPSPGTDNGKGFATAPMSAEPSNTPIVIALAATIICVLLIVISIIVVLILGKRRRGKRRVMMGGAQSDGGGIGSGGVPRSPRAGSKSGSRPRSKRQSVQLKRQSVQLRSIYTKPPSMTQVHGMPPSADATSSSHYAPLNTDSNSSHYAPLVHVGQPRMADDRQYSELTTSHYGPLATRSSRSRGTSRSTSRTKLQAYGPAPRRAFRGGTDTTSDASLQSVPRYQMAPDAEEGW